MSDTPTQVLAFVFVLVSAIIGWAGWYEHQGLKTLTLGLWSIAGETQSDDPMSHQDIDH